MPTTIPLSSCVSTTCVYNSHSRIPSQGIELVCSLAECGTDQTSRWYGSNIETNKPVFRQVQQTTVGACRPRVRRLRVRQGRLHREGMVPLAARQGQQGPVVLQAVLQQRGAHPQAPLTLPRCSVPNRSANVASFDVFVFRRRWNSRTKRGGSARAVRLPRPLAGAPATTYPVAGLANCYCKEQTASKK